MKGRKKKGIKLDNERRVSWQDLDRTKGKEEEKEEEGKKKYLEQRMYGQTDAVLVS